MRKKTLSLPDMNVTSAPDAIRYEAERKKSDRLSKKKKKKKMADSLGITRKQMQNYESAKCNMTVSRLWEIATLLNISAGFFINGLTEEKPFLENEDLRVIQKLHNIKDPKLQASLFGILKEL